MWYMILYLITAGNILLSENGVVKLGKSLSLNSPGIYFRIFDKSRGKSN